jgi:hypothetical protein
MDLDFLDNMVEEITNDDKEADANNGEEGVSDTQIGEVEQSKSYKARSFN